MKILKSMHLLLTPRKRLLNRLAETGADAEALAINLTRHAEMCTYPTLRAGLKQLASAETAQANAIRQLLLDNGVGPKLSSRPSHEGSSNWERLRNDLDLQIKILRALHSQVFGWASIDPQVAERLRESAVGVERNIQQLRDLTLKCDPQALD
jgi:hypothetical protein